MIRLHLLKQTPDLLGLPVVVTAALPGRLIDLHGYLIEVAPVLQKEVH